ncbi:unnamed protein product, partial [Prunus brigantina]
IQRQDLLGLSTTALWDEAEESEWLGANILTKHSHNLRSDHQPLDQSIKCVPTAKKRRTHDQGGCRDLPRFMGVTPPCITIPNADLTTHLPQSDSTMQIFSGHQADFFQPRLALQDSSNKY